MSLVIGPTYSFHDAVTDTIVADGIASVLDTPIVAFAYTAAILGDPVVFDAGADPHDLPVPIPHLPGLDEIELQAASFTIASAAYERTQSVPAGSPSGGSIGIALTGVAQGQRVSLTGIAISRLTLTPPDGIVYALSGSGGAVFWYIDDGDLVSSTSSPGGTVQQVHVLIRPGTGASAGPPIAAVPHFNMPGAGGALYGPALGGATLQVTRRSDGTADATITLSPAQPMTGCTMLIGTAAEGNAAIGPHAGLPTEVTAVTWAAASAEGRFDTRAQDISVTAHAGATDPAAGALVTNFDTDPGASLRTVDFAPAARAALQTGYPTATGADLGLGLRIEVGTPGSLYLGLGTVAARYVQRPDPVPATLALRGAPETVALPVPPGLRPMGLSFRVDGRYGPARLVADADSAPAASRAGYRLAGPSRIARRLSLTTKEATLPLARLALYGRASEATELLVTRHGGDDTRLGAALGPPVSIPIPASDRTAWHRVDVPVPDGLPPHAAAMWLVAEATYGTFWWHADPAPAPVPAQSSPDAGDTWTLAALRPLAQAWVNETDPATGDPAPLLPVSLSGPPGILNGDIVGIGEGTVSPVFTRMWVAEGDAHAALLDAIAGQPRTLALALDCRRDLDVTLSAAIVTYDPWSAGNAP